MSVRRWSSLVTVAHITTSFEMENPLSKILSGKVNVTIELSKGLWGTSWGTSQGTSWRLCCSNSAEIGDAVFFFEIVVMQNIDFTLHCHTSPLNHENEIFDTLNNHENKIFRKAGYAALNNSFEMKNPLIHEESGLKIKFFLCYLFPNSTWDLISAFIKNSYNLV